MFLLQFVKCIIYTAILGVICFPVGRLIANINFLPDVFPFKETGFEKEHKIYEKLRIKKWGNKVPDISRLFSHIVPQKHLNGKELNPTQVSLMINETCVAELVHYGLCFFGIALLFIWPGSGGVIFYLLYVFIGNVPFILIQRFNRPRLKKLLTYLKKHN